MTIAEGGYSLGILRQNDQEGHLLLAFSLDSPQIKRSTSFRSKAGKVRNCNVLHFVWVPHSTRQTSSNRTRTLEKRLEGEGWGGRFERLWEQKIRKRRGRESGSQITSVPLTFRILRANFCVSSLEFHTVLNLRQNVYKVYTGNVHDESQRLFKSGRELCIGGY